MASPYLNDAFFSRLETLALNLRADLAGFFGGKHLVRTYGQTVEFADYREYMLGDDIRRIDWNLYSRFEKFFIKLFTDERQMHTRIYLDCSASMGKFNRDKGDYAVAVAAALGFLSVHNMDKTSFRFLKEDKCENPYGTIVGKRSFFHTVGALQQLAFDGDTDISAAVMHESDAGTKDGLAVIVSDFFTDRDWKKAVDYFSYKKRQVMLIQVLTPEEIDPLYNGRVHLIDSEAGDMLDERNMKLRVTPAMHDAYVRALDDIKDELNTYCLSRGAAYLCVRTDVPIEKMLFGELLKKGTVS